MREILLYKPVREVEWLFFIVNAFCFLSYTTLSVIVTTKLRNVSIERSTKIIMLDYVLTFLCKKKLDNSITVKSIIWLISIVYPSSITKVLQIVDNII
jgi:hypothetical protein